MGSRRIDHADRKDIERGIGRLHKRQTSNGIMDNRITLDKELINESHILLTKVMYPDDVIDCCINLCEWEIKNRGKVGVKSETLSRHSVTYFDQDVNNQVNGYPVSLLGCLKPYRKARC